MKERKIALVTGGNRGIGFEICRQLLERDFKVIMGSRSLQKGQEAASELNGYVQVAALDMDDPESIRSVSHWIHKEYGQLDLLINNAGILLNADNFEVVDIASIETTFRTNLYGPLQLSQALLPLLEMSIDGRIVMVSSGMGAFSEMAKAFTAYRLSKAALNSLTAIMAQDCTSKLVKVIAACPGWCHTGMGSAAAPRTAAQGAASIIWAACSNAAQSGFFYRDGQPLDW